MNTAILHNGRAVDVSGLLNIRYSISGYLSSFETEEGDRFAFMTRQYFLDNPFEQFAAESYYYEVAAYALHIKDPHRYTLAELNGGSSRYAFIDAIQGANIEVGIVDIDINDPQFYRKKVYNFSHEINGRYFNEFTRKLDTSLMGEPEIRVISQSEVSTSFFNNHISVLETLETDEIKQSYLEDLVYTSLRVSAINRTIFPIILQNAEHCAEVIDTVNRLRDQWINGTIAEVITPEKMHDYRLTSYQFYQQVFKKQAFFRRDAGCEGKLHMLIKGLPLGALRLIPLRTKLDLLRSYIFYSEIRDDDEAIVVKMLYSISRPEDADLMLDYMLELRDGQRTNYEVFFNLMDDDRASRYAFGISFGGSHRRHFNFALYELWKISKYNFRFIPAGVTANDDGLNPNAFFLRDQTHIEGGGKHYYENAEPILEFSIHKESGGVTNQNGFLYRTVTDDYNTEEELDRERVIINKITTIRTTSVAVKTEGLINRKSEIEEEYGRYHLYQAITLFGYQPDLELTMPEEPLIPAFLFHYTEDFERLKEFDAGVVFAIEIGIEAALFYFTGGLSTLRHVRHLKHVKKVGRALGIGTALAPNEAVLIWRGLEGLAEVVAVSAGTITAYTMYAGNITNDSEEKALLDKVSTFFLFLTFASVGGALRSRNRTVKAADNVIAEVEKLTDLGISHGLPGEILDVVNTVKDSATISQVFLRNKLSQFTIGELGETNKLLDLFDSLTSLEKNNFIRHFGNEEGIDFWRKMNADEGKRVDLWKKVPNEYKNVRNDITYLDELYHLKVRDIEAVDHISIVKNRPTSGSTKFNAIGGHTENINLNGTSSHFTTNDGIEVLDPNFTHSIDTSSTSQKMIDYMNGVGDKIYSKNSIAKGHLEHKNILFKIDPPPENIPTDIPNSNRFILNGDVYQSKVKHSQYKWTQEELTHELAYALKNKIERRRSHFSNGHPKHNRSDFFTEIEYKSKLLDGTEVKIVFSSYHRYNERADYFFNHYRYFELNF